MRFSARLIALMYSKALFIQSIILSTYLLYMDWVIVRLCKAAICLYTPL